MPDFLTLIGPTASGKTAVAAHLALRMGGAVLSGDSRQVYRGMDIGTGKDLDDYLIDGRRVPYYLIDLVDAGEHYSLYEYLEDFDRVWAALPDSVPRILCGGTGLYIEAVLRGYPLPDVTADPELRAELAALSPEALRERAAALGLPDKIADPDNPRRVVRAIEVALSFARHGERHVDRPPLRGPIYALDISREERRRRIARRLDDRLRGGMIEEVEGLLARLRPEQLTYYGLEYRFVTEYVTGKLSFDEMKEQLGTAICRFAKRQMTWIRGMERRGLSVTWVTPSDDPRRTARQIETDYRQRTL